MDTGLTVGEWHVYCLNSRRVKWNIAYIQRGDKSGIGLPDVFADCIACNCAIACFQKVGFVTTTPCKGLQNILQDIQAGNAFGIVKISLAKKSGFVLKIPYLKSEWKEREEKYSRTMHAKWK